MSWRDAPLYVEAHDLARELFQRAPAWQAAGQHTLTTQTTEATARVLGAVALALTFPETRAHDLAEADRALVHLRCLLRLAQELGLLSAGAHRLLAGKSLAAGRMIGGWRKRVARTNLSPLDPGCGPPPAAGA